MVAGTHAELVSVAAELERRDATLARELDSLADVAERAGNVWSRAEEVLSLLERLPDEVEELGGRVEAAGAQAAAARAALAEADERVVALTRARRRKQDELDRAEREAATARQLVADSESDVSRLRDQLARLRAAEPGLRREDATLVHDAERIAAELARSPRIPPDGILEPGSSLGELVEWGLLVRSRVLVARAALEGERERIVTEANVLASGALGEPLGASSVTLLRRRLEEDV